MAETNEVIPGCGFHHVAIRAQDFDGSMHFYKDVLGFRTFAAWGEGDGRAALLDMGDGSLLEVFAGGAGDVEKGTIIHLALSCDDVDAAVERVRRAGAEVTVEPKDVDLVSSPPIAIRIAFFKGPSGEVVEFFHRRDG